MNQFEDQGSKFKVVTIEHRTLNIEPVIGGVAQLGERLPCTQEVIGSNPFTSTKIPGIGTRD